MRAVGLCLAALAGLAAGDDVAPTECWATAQAMGLTDDSWLLDFDRYPELFTDESVYLLPYTGAYVGADSIAEYVAFSAPGSAFFASQVSLDARVELSSVSGSNCSFVLLRHTLMSSQTPARPADFEFVSLIELNISVSLSKVLTFYYYWSPEFQGLINTFVMNTPETRAYVCERVLACGQDTGEAECLQRLGDLPVVEGDLNWADGDSQGCRFLHATFTEVNPDQHCAHIALDPTPDPDGMVKCHESYGLRPLDVFTAAQLELHEAYAHERGLPNDGLAFLCRADAECPPGYACDLTHTRRLLFSSLPTQGRCLKT